MKTDRTGWRSECTGVLGASVLRVEAMRRPGSLTLIILQKEVGMRRQLCIVRSVAAASIAEGKREGFAGRPVSRWVLRAQTNQSWILNG